MERSNLRDLLKVSKELEEKTRSNEGLAFGLLHLGEELQQTVDNMRTYRETLVNFRGGEDCPPHLPQIEEAYLQQLQRDNAELRSTLQEHKDALEIIMSTYRQQVCALMSTDSSRAGESTSVEEDLVRAQRRVFEMAQVMSEAASCGDRELDRLQERVAQLELENRSLRDLLYLADSMVLQPYCPAGSTQESSVGKKQQEEGEEDALTHSFSSSRSSRSLSDGLSSPTTDLDLPTGSIPPLDSSDGPLISSPRASHSTTTNIDISWPPEGPLNQDSNQQSAQTSSSLPDTLQATTAATPSSGRPDDEEVAQALLEMDEIFQPWLDEDGDSPNEDGFSLFTSDDRDSLKKVGNSLIDQPGAGISKALLEDSSLSKTPSLGDCTGSTISQPSLSHVSVDNL